MTSAHCEATIRLKGILNLLHYVTEEGFLKPFRNAVGTIDWSDPRPGYKRVGCEIDQIEQTFRQMDTEIVRFISAPSPSTTNGEVPLDEIDVLGHLRLTADDMNFLAQVVDYVRPIVDSLRECSKACKRSDFSLEEVSAKISSAAISLSRGADHLRPRKTPVLQMVFASGKTEYSIDQAGKVVSKIYREV